MALHWGLLGFYLYGKLHLLLFGCTGESPGDVQSLRCDPPIQALEMPGAGHHPIHPPVGWVPTAPAKGSSYKYL